MILNKNCLRSVSWSHLPNFWKLPNSTLWSVLAAHFSAYSFYSFFWFWAVASSNLGSLILDLWSLSLSGPFCTIEIWFCVADKSYSSPSSAIRPSSHNFSFAGVNLSQKPLFACLRKAIFGSLFYLEIFWPHEPASTSAPPNFSYDPSVIFRGVWILAYVLEVFCSIPDHIHHEPRISRYRDAWDLRPAVT